MDKRYLLKWRVPEMKELRIRKKWSLQKIAERFSVSRERVRQIIGNTGKLPPKPKKLSLGDKRTVIGGRSKIGTDAEIYVSELLSEMGIENELMKYHHPFDIKLKNGTRIEVKSAKKNTKILKSGTPIYTFKTQRNERGKYADFFILVIRDTMDVFVVPATETGLETTVRFCFPPTSIPSKFHKYHNRFDLLQP